MKETKQREQQNKPRYINMNFHNIKDKHKILYLKFKKEGKEKNMEK